MAANTPSKREHEVNSIGESGKQLDVIAHKINSDYKYAEQMFSDYDFAQKEFSQAGIEFAQNTFQQIVSGYKRLDTDASRNLTDKIMREKLLQLKEALLKLQTRPR